LTRLALGAEDEIGRRLRLEKAGEDDTLSFRREKGRITRGEGGRGEGRLVKRPWVADEL
jgi:hypothetical protein